MDSWVCSLGPELPLLGTSAPGGGPHTFAPPHCLGLSLGAGQSRPRLCHQPWNWLTAEAPVPQAGEGRAWGCLEWQLGTPELCPGGSATSCPLGLVSRRSRAAAFTVEWVFEVSVRRYLRTGDGGRAQSQGSPHPSPSQSHLPGTAATPRTRPGTSRQGWAAWDTHSTGPAAPASRQEAQPQSKLAIPFSTSLSPKGGDQKQ